MLCTDTAIISCSPLIHKWLNGIQQGTAIGLRCDVQVQVSVSWKKTLQRWVCKKNSVALPWRLITASSMYSNNSAFVSLQTVQERMSSLSFYKHQPLHAQTIQIGSLFFHAFNTVFEEVF